MAKISVAMATYNGGKYLREQLASLAAQNHLPHELHVGDDGSQDDSLAILAEFERTAPFPVIIHRNPQRLGCAENFLQTAHRCSGEWIAFCDQDDVWLPEKLAACAEGISRAGPDLRLVAHNAWIVRDDLSPLHRKTFWRGAMLKPHLALPPHWRCAGFTQIFHRDLVEHMPYEEGLRARRTSGLEAHDSWIPMLAAAAGSILLLGDPLALYRRHDDNLSQLFERLPRNRSREAARALRSNAGVYAKHSSYTYMVAGLLEDLATQARDAGLAASLAQAAPNALAYANFLARRAAVYRDRRLHKRLGAITGLLAAGGYSRSRPASLGPRALVKDLAYALLPARRAREGGDPDDMD